MKKSNKIATLFGFFNFIGLFVLIIPSNVIASCPVNNFIDTLQFNEINIAINCDTNFIKNKIQSLHTDDFIIDLIQQINESLYLSYLQTLVSFGPRVTGTSACTQAGEWIYSEFQDMGLDVRYHNWSHGGESGRNIEATLSGANVSSNHIFVMCAHYDTVLGSPGADDDGSGVAAVLSAAYVLSKYIVNYTVRFIAFSGEEQGLYGSYEYAKDAFNSGDCIVGVLNADMIGYAVNETQGEHIKIYNNSQSYWIVEYIDTVADIYFEYIDLNVICGGYSWGSDHSSFWQFGYDAVQYKEYEVTPYYHTPNDIIENMNVSYLAKCTKLFLATIAEFSQSSYPNTPPNAPTINGPESGKVGTSYLYLFSTSDPEEDIMYYYIDWGDGNVEEWLGPYDSGEEFGVSHTWEVEGDYTVKVKARDSFGDKSEWGYLDIIMPVNKQKYSYPFFELLNECILIPDCSL